MSSGSHPMPMGGRAIFRPLRHSQSVEAFGAVGGGRGSSIHATFFHTPQQQKPTQQYHVCGHCGGRGIVNDVVLGIQETFIEMHHPSGSPTSTSSNEVLFADEYPYHSSSDTFQGSHIGNSPRPPRECKFCRNNGEASETYSSHTLRCPATNKLICPVLRSHICDLCGATGDTAHTRNYCPKLSREEKMIRALPAQLHATMRQANGIRDLPHQQFFD